MRNIARIEGGLIYFTTMISMAGFDAGKMASFTVMVRTTDLFLILVGIWLIVHYGMQSVARRVAKGEEHTSWREAKEGEMEGIAAEEERNVHPPSEGAKPEPPS